MTTVRDSSASRYASWGLAVVTVIAVLAMALPAITGWEVNIKSFPPIHANWQPRVGPGTLSALLIAFLVLVYGQRVCESWPWRRLLAVCWVTGAAWALSLAMVDGSSGIGYILGNDYEYLQTARAVNDVPMVLNDYISKIPLDAPTGNWPTHVAGHPPGALLFFVLLARTGLGGGFAAGMVVTLLGATTAVGVLITVRVLGAPELARRAAPFVTIGPAAIWHAVSADAVFAAVGAWGIAALAYSATRKSLGTMLGFSALAGLLLGYLVMMSYGLPLFGLLAVAVLVVAKSWRPLIPTIVSALVVVGAFAAFGFAWWEAISVLRERYWDGIASSRPASYWIWANLAALTFAAGPLLGAGVAEWVRRVLRVRPTEAATRAVLWLSGAGIAMVAAADLSLMSKAEVERIWLPFVPWLLLSCALLPPRWRTGGLAVQIAFALLVQHLLHTSW
ncbi:hypothetical protein [Demetria terragena]|uniref:hypothetical protein n=1 Tax=Demetria terragena TaxID=63959 RepID=UPI00037B061F|nr:hypothetical protein [Demetria terragena]